MLDCDAQDHQSIEFLLTLGDGELMEIISYNELSNFISEQHQFHIDGKDELFHFHKILDHQGPLNNKDPCYNGSSWNVSVLWDDGTVTWEPLNEIAKFAPLTMACYGQDHTLLSLPGWQFLQCTAKHHCLINHMCFNAMKDSNKYQPHYKFSIKIPQSYKEALIIDQEICNSLWKDVPALELKQLQEYDAFQDLGPDGVDPPGYTIISVWHIFDLSFISELNNQHLMQGDIGNAYLESYTNEKVYFMAGPEFGSLQGQNLIIVKALYSLHSSGLHFHDKFADTLHFWASTC